MKQLLMRVSLCGFLIMTWIVGRAEIMEVRPNNSRPDSKSLGDFVAPDGHIDLGALQASDYKGRLDLDTKAVHIDPVTGIPAVTPATPQSPANDLDDIYWDNSISPSIPGVNGGISATTIFNGELIIAGSFTMVGDVPANSIASWNGSSWSALGTGIRYSGDPYISPAEVVALAVFDNKLIAAGSFFVAGDVYSANHIAAWDGTSWSSLGSGILGKSGACCVRALTVYNNKLIVGGSFSGAGGIPADNLAAWDGISWSSLVGVAGLGPYSSWILSLAVFEDELIVGGWFTSAGGLSVNNIVSWDGYFVKALGAGRNGSVRTLAVYDNKLIAGGDFATGAWDGSSWSTLGAGLERSWTLGVYDNKLIAGGYFTSAEGAPADYLASWDGESWSALRAGPNSGVHVLGFYEDKLIVGGSFSNVGEAPSHGISAWEGLSWSPLISSKAGLDGRVFDLAVYGGRLIAGGNFSSAGDAVGRIASWDGNSWSTLGSGTKGAVNALTVFDNRLIAGGSFTAAGGVSSNHIAAWDGGSWSTLGEGTSRFVDALAVYRNNLIVGEQALIGDPGWGQVEVWRWDGADWTTLGPVMNSDYGALELEVYKDQLILARCGYGGMGSAGHLDVWDGADWSPIDSDLCAVGGTIIFDDKLIVGEAKYWGWGFCLPMIRSWDGADWTDIERADWTDTVISINGLATAFAVFDSKLIVGGDFTQIGGVQANRIAAWDGVSWSALGSGTNGPVQKLAVYKNRLIVAGNFTSAGGKISPYLAVWTKRDVQEVSLDIEPGSCPNPLNVTAPRGDKANSGVLPVAVLGNDEFDVRDIDVSSLELEGAVPLRYGYKDVATPPSREDDCACSEMGPDGYTDLELKFRRLDVVAGLGSVSGGNVPVTLTGQMKDGTQIEGVDCVRIVPRKGDGGPRPGSSNTAAVTALGRATPNPFNPVTTIGYELAERGYATLKVYDVTGKLVATLVDGEVPPGRHEVTWKARGLASGVYFYRLEFGDFVQTRKMILLK